MSGGIRPLLRGALSVLAHVVLAPAFLLHAARIVSFETVSRTLSLIPGLGGMWLRRAWYRRTLAACGESLYVDFLGAIRTPRTRVGHHVYVGTACWIGWADLGDDVMLGGHIVILSGLGQHRFDRRDVPKRLQPGEARCVRIGRDVWVGNGAIIGTDVSDGTVVAAGSVVTRTFPPYTVIGGVPARPLRDDGPATPGEEGPA